MLPRTESYLPPTSSIRNLAQHNPTDDHHGTNGKAHSRYTQNLSNTTMTTPRITKKGKRSSTIPLHKDHAQLLYFPNTTVLDQFCTEVDSRLTTRHCSTY